MLTDKERIAQLEVVNEHYKKTIKNLVKEIFEMEKSKKVTKWLNVYSNGTELMYNTKKDAEDAALSGRVVCIKLTGEK